MQLLEKRKQQIKELTELIHQSEKKALKKQI